MTNETRNENGEQKLDSDALPPTQQLVLEVLAARGRLGEPFWTFSRKTGPALRKLAAAGWLRFDHAVTDDWRVALSDAGKAATCAPTYLAPLQADVQRLTAERDQARAIAVVLEQQVAEALRIAENALVNVIMQPSIRRLSTALADVVRVLGPDYGEVDE